MKILAETIVVDELEFEIQILDYMKIFQKEFSGWNMQVQDFSIDFV